MVNLDKEKQELMEEINYWDMKV
jgi:hypothetical protein